MTIFLLPLIAHNFIINKSDIFVLSEQLVFVVLGILKHLTFNLLNVYLYSQPINLTIIHTIIYIYNYKEYQIKTLTS